MQIQYNTIQIQNNTVQIQNNTVQIQYNTNTKQYNTNIIQYKYEYNTMQIQIQYNTIQIQYNTIQIQYNITLLPSVNTLIARGMFCGAKYTHHTFTPIIKHLITTTANKHPGKKSCIDKNMIKKKKIKTKT